MVQLVEVVRKVQSLLFSLSRSATVAAAIDNDKAVKRWSREVSAILNDLN
jgi:hypothetical protein